MRCRLAMLGLLSMMPLAALVGWWQMPEPRVTEANCESILDGMTRGEVEAILGDAPRYEEGITLEGKDFAFGTWEESGRMIVVGFCDGHACYSRYMEYTLLERLEEWYRGSRPRKLEAA